MTLEQKRVFLGDIMYVMNQAKAYREYVACGHQTSLLHHPFHREIHNALLESSLAFLRKLNEFFKGDSKASISVFWPGYPGEWLWTKHDSDLLNRRVTHPSLDHALDGQFDWGDFINTHLPEAERRFEIFLSRLRDEQPALFQQNG